MKKYLIIGTIALAIIIITVIILTSPKVLGTKIMSNINTHGDVNISSNLSVSELSTLGKTSSTMFSVYQGFYAGTTATTSITGAGALTVAGTATFSNTATSTFGGNILINKSSTSTAQLGGTYGGCLVLGSGAAGNVIYLYPLIGDGGIYLATSTKAADCY